MRGSSGTGRAQRRRCLPCAPPGGRRWRQGAASVRARCRTDGGPEQCLAAQRQGGGSPAWRRGISRCTDRSAGGCADRQYLCDSLSASHGRRPPRAASSWQCDEGSSRPLSGHTAAAVTAQVRVLPSRSYPHALGKRGRTSRSTAAVRGTWVVCLWREQEGERFGAARHHAVVRGWATTRPVSPSRPGRRGCCPEERVRGRRGRGARGPCVLPRHWRRQGPGCREPGGASAAGGRHGLLARCVRPYASHGTIEALETRDVLLTVGTKPWKTGACFLSRTSVGFRGL